MPHTYTPPHSPPSPQMPSQGSKEQHFFSANTNICGSKLYLFICQTGMLPNSPKATLSPVLAEEDGNCSPRHAKTWPWSSVRFPEVGGVRWAVLRRERGFLPGGRGKRGCCGLTAPSGGRRREFSGARLLPPGEKPKQCGGLKPAQARSGLARRLLGAVVSALKAGRDCRSQAGGRQGGSTGRALHRARTAERPGGA